LLIGVILLGLLLSGCEQNAGFYYPDVGLRFRPHGSVKTDADYSHAVMADDPRYDVIIPPTLTTVSKGSELRVITTGIRGSWTVTTRPLYDEVAITCYNESTWCNYQLLQERAIEVPWRGLYPPEGTLRVFHLTSKRTSSGGCCCRPRTDTDEQYTTTVTVYHGGNTIEFCLRGQAMLSANTNASDLFKYTDGVTFVPPSTAEDTAGDTNPAPSEGSA
jgi:hypothetical protein